MPYTIEYNPEKGIVVATIGGLFDLDMIKTYLSDLIPVLQRHTCKKLLTDLRKITSEMSLPEINQIPQIAEEMGYDPLTKCAILLPEDHNAGVQAQFFETVTRKQSQPVTIFVNYDEALAWLTNDLVKT